MYIFKKLLAEKRLRKKMWKTMFADKGYQSFFLTSCSIRDSKSNLKKK